MRNNLRAVGASLLLLLFAAALLMLPAGQEKMHAAKTPPGPWKRITNAQPAKCGDGVSGDRVQLVYMRGHNQPSRLGDEKPNFGNYARQLNAYLVEASLRNGGVRKQANFVSDKFCRPTVVEAVIQETDDLEDRIVASDPAQGKRRTYIVFDDLTNYYCGMGYQPESGPGFAWVGKGCWNTETALHEFLHTIGAVNPKAPTGTRGYHCLDGRDIMCYDDGSEPFRPYTEDKCRESVVDCGNDTYFDARRIIPPTSWLFLNPHANAANSKYLTSR